MATKAIQINEKEVYIINIPETPSDDPLSLPDQIIIEQQKKIKELETLIKFMINNFEI